MGENVFKVVYECGNCGKRFSERYPANTQVREDLGGISVREGTVGSLPGNYVECPNCKLSDDIILKKRTPIE